MMTQNFWQTVVFTNTKKGWQKSVCWITSGVYIQMLGQAIQCTFEQDDNNFIDKCSMQNFSIVWDASNRTEDFNLG